MGLYALVFCFVVLLGVHVPGSTATPESRARDAIDFAKARARKLYPEAKKIGLDDVSSPVNVCIRILKIVT